jgi:hypothetical protein
MVRTYARLTINNCEKLGDNLNDKLLNLLAEVRDTFYGNMTLMECTIGNVKEREEGIIRTTVVYTLGCKQVTVLCNCDTRNNIYDYELIKGVLVHD